MDAALRGSYPIARELGHGGMATVYLAHDTRHDRPVALKVLKPALADSVGSERFLREIRLTAQLQHAHILPLLDSGLLETAPGRSVPYYVMPYVEGESLRDRLARERQLPVEDALRIAGDVAGALAYAHGRGVVHRDIKPENILISNSQAMVADFGIARALSLAGDQRLTETGLALGTPHYMSPEQASGDRAVDARTDVYALGCVLYEMLAGEPPFTGPTAQAIVARSLIDPAPPIRNTRPTVSDEIARVLDRALAKIPADRFADAGEFEAALSRATSVPQVSRAAPGRRRGLIMIGIALLAAIVTLSLSRRGGSRVIGSASSIAILPFTPSGTDTALARLGRDLVFTLTAELDGLGGLRAVDAHAVLARATPEALAAPSERARLARSFGAGSLVQGSLVRVGSDVRLDLALLGTDSLATPLARATVTAPQDSIAALTDSAARAVLVQIWSRGSPPTPSLDAALRTRSVVGLRAFLQGEGQIIHGDWSGAAASYQQAMNADPGFWLAYARHVYARYWSVSEPSDTVLRLLDRHRTELPERERLITEAIILQGQDSIRAAIERSRAAIERYPDSWFGWLFYGDGIFHNGPLLGISQAEAGAAFERAIELNSSLIPAWEHLMLLSVLDGDTAATNRALETLERLGAGPVLTADGYGNRMLQFRYLQAVQRADSASLHVLTDSLARDKAPAAVGEGSFYDPFRFSFYPQQVEVSRRALAVGGPAERLQVHRFLYALSWAGRGAWDSALAGFDRYAEQSSDSMVSLQGYGLAVFGVWLGTVDSQAAIARRSPAARAASDVGTAQAELAWLDGLLAAANGSKEQLAEARVALRRSGDSARGQLDRSLAGFDAALHGQTREAGQRIAALEWEQAAISAPDFTAHPFVIPVNRMAAARWLAATGDAAQALRLLRWAESPFSLHSSTPYTLTLTALADLERGRIEERLGHSAIAAGYYRRFLRRYDRPVPQHLPLVWEAKRRLERETLR